MFLSEPEWQAVLLSLKVSSAVALSLPFGIFFRLLVRRTFPGKALLDSILHLPLVGTCCWWPWAARVYWQLAV